MASKNGLTVKQSATDLVGSNTLVDDMSARAWLAKTTQLQEVADKVIYIYFRVNFVGEVNLSSQTFLARFDMYLLWDAKLGVSKHVEGAAKTFNPIMRFPQSQSWSEIEDLGVAIPQNDKGLVGERRTIEGAFTCQMEMEAFPFDAQALDVVIHPGRDRVSGEDCTLENGYKILHYELGPNMIAPQVSDQYTFRPCRYTLTHTTRLESAKPRSEYMLSIVVARQYGFFLANHYLFLLLLMFLSFSFWVIPEDDYPNRLTVSLTLLLIVVAFRWATPRAGCHPASADSKVVGARPPRIPAQVFCAGAAPQDQLHDVLRRVLGWLRFLYLRGRRGLERRLRLLWWQDTLCSLRRGRCRVLQRHPRPAR